MNQIGASYVYKSYIAFLWWTI